MVTLCIDASHDEATQQVYDYRNTYLYPKLAFTPTYICAIDAVPSVVESALDSTDFILITGSGHGEADTFMGYQRQALFKASQPDLSRWFSNRMVHLLSCNTAQELGPALKHQGCKAYFGYNDFVTFNTGGARFVLDCDAEIIVSLLLGHSPEEAYRRTLSRYDAAIDAAHKANAIRAMVHLRRMRNALRFY